MRLCENIPCLRQENRIVENEINSPLQIYLYDFLYEQQDLYNEYSSIFKSINLKPRKNLPFNDFILSYHFYLNEIKTDVKKINQLKKLRWYLCFDKDNYYEDTEINLNINLGKSSLFDFDINSNSYDNINESFSSNGDISININDNILFQNCLMKKCMDDITENEPLIIDFELIKKLIKGEDNKIFFLLKCIHLSVSNFCQQTMNYLYSTYKNNQYEFIKEYNKRYNNFIDCAILINKTCENVNVAVNFLYEEILNDYPSFPKFSIFRLLLKTWYTEMTNKINEYDSIMSFFKQDILSIYLNFLSRDLDSIKMNISLPIKNSSSFGEYFIHNSNHSFNDLKNTNFTSKVSKDNSLNKNKIICPFGSFYEDNNICYSIIEQGLNSLNDIFCNEYSVYLLNLTYIDTNNIYNDLINNISDSIQSKIEVLFNNLIIEEKFSETKVINEILKYFSSYFYTNRIINKLKMKIFSTVHVVLSILLLTSLKEKFKYFLRNFNINTLKNSGKVYKNLNINSSVYEKLYEELKIYPYDERIKILIINKFSCENFSNQLVYFNLLKQVDKWFNQENEKMLKKNKKIEKEILKKNISNEFNEYKRALLSLSLKPNFDLIKKVRKIEKEYNKKNNEFENDDIQMEEENNINESFNINGVYDINNFDINNNNFNVFDNGLDFNLDNYNLNFK